ncbi:hypothetical protein OS493_029422 [Desmophyllum pertusum]|uniref:Uncharacterized protein n=1 Tax=Desmophyllum pertusum TaxID=174260 RepID=A0A9X0CK57_9CNID|nr:hypothetical protein OS493_029422 [Desmophyllum pertusum]
MITGFTILVLMTLFYYYFVSGGKASELSLNRLILSSTTSKVRSAIHKLGKDAPLDISLQAYDSSVKFDSVWFKKNCLATVTQSEGIGNIGIFVDVWKRALGTNCRDLYKTFSDIYLVRDRTAPVTIPDTFAPKVLKWLGGKKELLKEASLQHITSVENIYTQESTVFNPLRAKRPGAGGGATEETKKFVKELLVSSAKDCDFCNYKTMTAQDPFGRVESKYSVSVSNTFKVEKFHGLILWKQHNPLEINEAGVSTETFPF